MCGWELKNVAMAKNRNIAELMGHRPKLENVAK